MKDVLDQIAILNAKATITWQQMKMALRRAKIIIELSHVDFPNKDFEEIGN